jgi:putative ABC transport system ATP-binding protein
MDTKNLQIIRTEDLSFLDIINYPDIEIFENQITFIEGASGSGKSTLLKMFNLSLSPSKGNIFFYEKNINEYDSLLLRKQILLNGQTPFVFQGDIRTNFEKYYQYRDLEKLSDEKIKEYLNICGIDFPLEKECISMSGGEKQRVHMAISLSFLPKVLLLDEPTSALDKKNSDIIMENIFSFCNEKSITAIVVSHDQEISKKFADKTIIIEGNINE